MHYLSPWCCWDLDGPIYQDWSPVALNLFAKKKKKNSCLFSDFRLIFVFIFLFHFIFFCSNWYLTEIKIYTNQLDQVRLLFLLTLLVSTWFSCYILIFFFFFIQDIYLRVSFLTIEDNVWFRFGGIYIDFYLFVLFCLVVLKKYIYFA